MSTLDSVTRARIDSVFASYVRPDAPGCALLVRRDGATAYARGYGMASLELGVPITPATVMDIASTSKQFTATAVWMLAFEGKLSLDDEVQRYLPELPRLGPGPAYRVTIHQMLQHTSGWPDYVDLLLAGGTPFEAAATAGDAMAVLARQRVGAPSVIGRRGAGPSVASGEEVGSAAANAASMMEVRIAAAARGGLRRR